MSDPGHETIILGLGGNLGDPAENMRRALEMLRDSNVHSIRTSSLYKTSPIGVENQPDFINAAAVAETGLAPLPLLDKIKEIEKVLGRDSGTKRWGPRPVDIDILFYGNRIVSETNLTIPHPRLGERLFVLEPVMEIAPDFELPGGGLFSDFFHRRLGEFDFSCQSVEKLP